MLICSNVIDMFSETKICVVNLSFLAIINADFPPNLVICSRYPLTLPEYQNLTNKHMSFRGNE
uniref:Uncharacterized protein n=1 Tax=Pristionchus pacificus TaxID=54126 RepID=A0A2A6C7H5_PRIPA|eukprot:PDM74057.1 hypothetical protein PRIPAC_41413 [Pristionchus pacificus]